MKQYLKRFIKEIIKDFNIIDNKLSINNISIYISVVIASFSLQKQRKEKASNSRIVDISNELEIIQQRYPDLVQSFFETNSKLNKQSLSKIHEGIKKVFEETNDDDIDDLISWSYQYLKKDLANQAFKKIGKNKNKIQDVDLLFTTQFFTDKYMVKYLVDEALAGYNKVQELVVIDPACGGGNFLNYSFERLYYLYKESKPSWSNKQIVDTILEKAILGFDLDSNLSRIASLSLFVKVCKYSVPSKSIQIKVFGGTENDKLGFLRPNVKSNSINKSTFSSQITRVRREKRIKVFLTNPPFMGKRDMDTSLKLYLISNYPESKGDLCVSFIQRFIELMDENDVLGVVSQNSWMYLSSFKQFRKLFLEKQTLRECIDLGSNAFKDINGEKTNVALFIIGNSETKTSSFYNLKFKNIIEKKDILLKKDSYPELTYEVNQNIFIKNDNFELNYQIKDRFDNFQKIQQYSDFGNPMQGTSTGDNTIFVKFAWEVNGRPDWKSVSKGGGHCKWVGLNYYKVLWGKNAEIIKAHSGSAIRNLKKIPTTQLVYSDTGTLGLSVRLLKNDQVFIASGPGIQVLSGNKYAHLAFLNSRIATFFLKLSNPKLTVSAGYISKIPVTKNILDSNFIAQKSKECVELKEKYLQRKLPNLEFCHQDYTNIDNAEFFIINSIIEDVENDYQRILLESKIELNIKKKYNFSSKELHEIKTVVGESPFFNKNKSLRLSIEKLDLLLSSSLDLNCMSPSRANNGMSVGSESLLEKISYKLDVNPNAILKLIKNNAAFLHVTKDKYYADLLHKILLYELGVKQIISFNYAEIDINVLLENINIKYPFLKDKLLSRQKIFSILNTHHRISFFNKPIVSVTKNNITVGKFYNE